MIDLRRGRSSSINSYSSSSSRSMRRRRTRNKMCQVRACRSIRASRRRTQISRWRVVYLTISSSPHLQFTSRSFPRQIKVDSRRSLINRRNSKWWKRIKKARLGLPQSGRGTCKTSKISKLLRNLRRPRAIRVVSCSILISSRNSSEIRKTTRTPLQMLRAAVTKIARDCFCILGRPAPSSSRINRTAMSNRRLITLLISKIRSHRVLWTMSPWALSRQLHSSIRCGSIRFRMTSSTMVPW